MLLSTHHEHPHPREGKRLLSRPPIFGPGRGIFTLSNGALYAVVGQTVYFINPDFKWVAFVDVIEHAS
jgi:hypothetical protein